MRALIRVLPLLVAAAHVAACAANNVATGVPAGMHYAAAASPPQPAVKRAVREPPSQALLARQPSPHCALSKPLEGVPPDQARAAMLDYEQQCYRQRADIVHAQLAALQDAAKTRAFGSADRTLLERQPPPHCEPAKPAPGLGAAEAREATLDADRQCYKQLEASERQKLAALQDAVRKGLDAPRGQRGHARRAPRQRYLTY